MFSFRSFITASLALVSLTTTACVGSEETVDSPDLFDDVPIETADVGGHSGTNSLHISSYLKEDEFLYDITTRQLKESSPAGTQLINSASIYFAGTPEGKEVLTYATRCALSNNDAILDNSSPPVTFPGSGILTSTTGWGSAALTDGQREDLFTCMITHLNPSAYEVDIYLKGPHIAADASDGTTFDFNEAVWVSNVSRGLTTGLVAEYHVYPQPDLRTTCGPFLDQSLGTRVCGTALGCGSLIIHTAAEFAADCTGSNNSYTCKGKPAIHTKIKKSQLKKFYPRCGY